MKKYFINIDYKQKLMGGASLSGKLFDVIDADLEVETLSDICDELLEDHGIDDATIKVNQFNLL